MREEWWIINKWFEQLLSALDSCDHTCLFFIVHVQNLKACVLARINMKKWISNDIKSVTYLDKLNRHFPVDFWSFTIYFQFAISNWERNNFIMSHASSYFVIDVQIFHHCMFTIQSHIKNLQISKQIHYSNRALIYTVLRFILIIFEKNK